MDTGTGLLVPVVRDVDKLSYVDLCLAVDDVATRARDRKVSRDDLSGASFTISNLGGFGVGAFTPIVNAPEVAILGVGGTQERPVFEGKKVVARKFMSLSLSYDHRVIDGAQGARFIQHLASELSDGVATIEKELS